MKLIKRMTSLVVLAVSLNAWAEGKDDALNGAGASFPAPAYTRWISDYNKNTGVKLNYQSVGSSAGIQQIKARTVHFGASDDPMNDTELNQNQMIQFPTLIGGVVIIANIPGVKAGGVTLNGDVLAKIYAGKIQNWNDRNIRRLNKEITLPNLPIRVVYRADGSGTTAIFTDYLCKASTMWKKDLGSGKSIRWPVGAGGQKNPGVLNLVLQTEGGIGYVEYAYAIEQNATWCKMQNVAGKVVAPNETTFTAAADAADWDNAPNFAVNMNNVNSENAWPIVGASYVMIYRTQPQANQAKKLLNFWIWCLENGQKSAEELKYIPMPQSVVQRIKAKLKNDVKDANGNPIL